MSSRVASWWGPILCTAVLILPGCGPPPATDETDPLPHPFNNQEPVMPSDGSIPALPVPMPGNAPKSETVSPEQPESGSSETRSEVPQPRDQRGQP